MNARATTSHQRMGARSTAPPTHIIRGVDAIAGLAFEAWAKRAADSKAPLTEEERGSLRRNKIDFDGFYAGDLHSVTVDLMTNKQRQQFRNSLSSQSGAGGNFTVPTGTFVAAWEAARDALPLMRLATLDRVPRGTEWRYPMYDDRGTAGMGHLVSENTTDDSSNFDVAFKLQQLKPYKASSGIIKVPNELPQDSLRWVPQMATLGARRAYRLINYLGINGTGAGQPVGLAVSTTKVTAASATAISYDDLVNLVDACSDGVQDGGSPYFMFHKTILKSLMLLKDGQGKPVLDLRDRKIMGFPFAINSACPSSIASGTVSAYFGNFSSVVITEIADVRIDIFGERYGDVDQSLWRAIQRFDIALIDPGDHPVVALQH